MTESGPFHPTAHLYDLVYSHLDYEAHAATVEGIIGERQPQASSLLDVACGTGKHLAIWGPRFERVAGLDLDEGLLAVAAERVPDVALHQGDYTDFDLDETFDAVTCLFSSIGYARTVERLDAAVASMARHLTPGGVLVIEPWFRSEMLEPPWVRLHTVERADVVVARTSRMEVGETVSDLEMNYLVTTVDATERHTERHLMGLFTPEQFEHAFTAAGLDFEWDPVGTFLERGLAIGVRPN